MHSDLIFDVGANNGDDTSFYVRKGFRVVAVEADPSLCVTLKQRFSSEIAEGIVVIENFAVADADGTLPFYKNSYSEWSSLSQNSKATTENSHDVILVQTTPLSSIIERHGTPYYLKIDIEGGELAAMRSIIGREAPRYLSFEMNRDLVELLTTAQKIGYTEYAFVPQGKKASPPNPPQEGKYIPMTFTYKMSGLFGKEISAPWMSLEGIRAEIAARRERKEASWADIHCR